MQGVASTYRNFLRLCPYNHPNQRIVLDLHSMTKDAYGRLPAAAMRCPVCSGVTGFAMSDGLMGAVASGADHHLSAGPRWDPGVITHMKDAKACGRGLSPNRNVKGTSVEGNIAPGRWHQMPHGWQPPGRLRWRGAHCPCAAPTASRRPPRRWSPPHAPACIHLHITHRCILVEFLCVGGHRLKPLHA